jgi:hypothetical protein
MNESARMVVTYILEMVKKSVTTILPLMQQEIEKQSQLLAGKVNLVSPRTLEACLSNLIDMLHQWDDGANRQAVLHGFSEVARLFGVCEQECPILENAFITSLRQVPQFRLSAGTEYQLRKFFYYLEHGNIS